MLSKRTHGLLGFGALASIGMLYLINVPDGNGGMAPLALELNFGIGQVSAATSSSHLNDIASVPSIPIERRPLGVEHAGVDGGGGQLAAATSPALEYGLDQPAGPTPGAPDERDARELERRERLARYYAPVSIDSLVEQHRRLSRDLGTKINTEASARFAAGEGAAPGPEEIAKNGTDRWGQMVRYSADDNGHKVRVVLREEDNPKLYEMRRELDWLYGEVRKRKRGN